MRVSNLRIGLRLGLIVGGITLAYSGLLAYLLVTYHVRLEQGTARAAMVLKATDLGRQAHVDFKVQVQEWKNILLRGGDPAEFDKYKAAFGKAEANVQADLKALRELLVGAGADGGRIERLLGAHAELGEKYRQALQDYNSGSIGGAHKVDVAVRGIDRAPTKEMDAVVADVGKFATERQSAAARENGALRTFAITVALLLLLPIAAVSAWFCRDIARSLHQMVERIRDIAEGEGDLTKRVAVQSRDEVGEAAGWMNTFIGKVHDVVARAREVARHSSAAAEQLSTAAGRLSSGSQEQASSLEETAASLEEVAGTVKQNAENARQASQLALDSRATAEKGGQIVAASVASMQEITQASRKIAEIIGVIDEIAFQTNLLALNAAVEAARAGEQGRGFAVVAAEVRNLAQRSATAAKEIKALIRDSVQRVEQGSELVTRSGQALGDILTAVRRVSDIIAEIAAASEEQSRGIDQVNRAVAQMDHIVQENATQTEELSTTAQALAGQSTQLRVLVEQFRVTATPAAAAKPVASSGPVPRAAVAPHRAQPEPVLAGRFEEF